MEKVINYLGSWY